MIRNRPLAFLTSLGIVLLLAFRLTAPQGHPEWDRAILDWFSQIRNDRLDQVMTALTWLGSLFLLGPLAALIAWWLYRQQQARHAVLLLVALGGVAVIGRCAKWWIDRPRPDFHTWLSTLPLDTSYPSLHALQATAFFLALALIMPRLWLWFLAAFLASLVALSRLYLQVHFPSDILAGMAGATIWTLALYWMQTRSHEK